MTEKKSPEAEPSRRGFVVATAVASCAIAGVVGVPAAAFIATPLRSESGGGGKKYTVGKLDELVVGIPTKVSIIGDEVDAWTRSEKRRLGSVWLLRVSEKEVRALSVICPHLGCGIEIGNDLKSFACPCHDSTFGFDGVRAAGPSPRNMDALPVELGEGGVLTVTFQRFRIGISEKKEIG